MFLISSSHFRRATKERIFFCFRPNQAVAFQQRTGVTITLNNGTKIVLSKIIRPLQTVYIVVYPRNKIRYRHIKVKINEYAFNYLGHIGMFDVLI